MKISSIAEQFEFEKDAFKGSLKYREEEQKNKLIERGAIPRFRKKMHIMERK